MPATLAERGDPIRSVRTLVFLAVIATLLGGPATASAQSSKLRFGVDPLQPTPGEAKKAYEPFFA